jgi:hypothetical protein
LHQSEDGVELAMIDTGPFFNLLNNLFDQKSVSLKSSIWRKGLATFRMAQGTAEWFIDHFTLPRTIFKGSPALH